MCTHVLVGEHPLPALGGKQKLSAWVTDESPSTPKASYAAFGNDEPKETATLLSLPLLRLATAADLAIFINAIHT